MYIQTKILFNQLRLTHSISRCRRMISKMPLREDGEIIDDFRKKTSRAFKIRHNKLRISLSSRMANAFSYESWNGFCRKKFFLHQKCDEYNDDAPGTRHIHTQKKTIDIHGLKLIFRLLFFVVKLTGDGDEKHALHCI